MLIVSKVIFLILFRVVISSPSYFTVYTATTVSGLKRVKIISLGTIELEICDHEVLAFLLM